MNRHGLKVTLISGVDGETADAAQENLLLFKNKNLKLAKSAQHIASRKKIHWKTELTSGVFAYLLSQQRVFEDALQRGYKRILVFDDDVFFHSSAHDLLQQVFLYLPEDFKVLLLGASEYADLNSSLCVTYRRPNMCKTHHPVPGYTCGSFATIYDQSIYHELLSHIRESAGPFDNAALGAVYLRHRDKCYVADPAICIPDVANSTLRKVRNQYSHSAKMNWETVRYGEFIKPIIVTILIASIGLIEKAKIVKGKLGSNVTLNIFCKTPSGLQPVKLGGTSHPCNAGLKDSVFDAPVTSFSAGVNNFLIPPSDIVMDWPEGKAFTYNGMLSVCSTAMLAQNQQGEERGMIDGVDYCFGHCGTNFVLNEYMNNYQHSEYK